MRIAKGKKFMHLSHLGLRFGREMSRVIESQRAYSYAMKMVQTSDEIVSTVNALRQ